MADRSKIEWTDATWNPITGCVVVSPGCTNCYAMKLAGTRMKSHPSRTGLTRDTKAGPVWTGEVRLNSQWLDLPLRWIKSRRVFVVAHGDLFVESVPDEWIDHVFAVMALAPQHTFQVLTKRPDRMHNWLARARVRSPGIRELVYSHIKNVAGYDPDHAGFMRRAHAASAAWPLPNVRRAHFMATGRKRARRPSRHRGAVRWLIRYAAPWTNCARPARHPSSSGTPRCSRRR